MKTVLKFVSYHSTFERWIMAFVSVALTVALVSKGRVQAIFMAIVALSVIILFVRSVIRFLQNRRPTTSDFPRQQVALNMLNHLAKEMNVELHPTKYFEVPRVLVNANSIFRPFYSGGKFHYGGKIQLGYVFLQDLDDTALRGILGHELAHIKKKHSLKRVPFIILFAATPILTTIGSSKGVILALLAFTISVLAFTVLLWFQEYEADAISARYVGNEEMAHSLDRVLAITRRPGNSFTHPSIARRISRLLLEAGLK